MPKNNRSEVRQARALAIQDIERTYQNWRALIAEKQAELQQRQALDDDDLLGAPQQAQVRKAKLLPAVRQEMTEVLRMRQQIAQEAAESEARQAGTAAPEPDVVYEALLTSISEELEGKKHPQGWALVWYEGQLHEFNHLHLRSGTDEDDYLTVSKEVFVGQNQLFVGVAGVIGIVAMLAFGYWMFLYTPAVAVSGAMQVTVGQRTVSLWGGNSLAVGEIETKVSAQAGYPVRVCASTEQQKAALPDASVILTSTEAVRSYRIGATYTDLDILDCNSSPPRQVASAKLVDIHTFQTSSLEIQGIEVWGPDTDPASIPTDRMVVDIIVDDPNGAEGTLILADGTRYAATSSVERDGMTIVRYLVPFSATPQRVGLERTGHALPELLALDLPAPTSRIALLRRVLQVSQATATIENRDGQPILAISLTVKLADDAAPLTLIPSDVSVQAGSQTASVSWEPPTLQPGEQREILLSLPLPQVASLDLSLATWRTRLPLR
jgi:hypothetical protein